MNMLERFAPWKKRPVLETMPQTPRSPVSETSSSGEPTPRQREVWVTAAAERARVRAELVRDFVSHIEQQPGSLYRGRREDARSDLLLGEVVLDFLPHQATTKTVMRVHSQRGGGAMRVLIEEYTLPGQVQIAGKSLVVGEILGAGAFGVVVECGDNVVKFISTGIGCDNNFLMYAAREISALARFHPREDSDPVFLQAMEAAQISPRTTRTTDRIPGFLGATRVTFPTPQNEQEPIQEYIAIAMERVRGQDLKSAMENPATFESVTPQTYVELTRQLAQALAAFHEANILHRDVKPGNVMIHFPAPGQVDAKLTDMGLAVDSDYRVRVQKETAARKRLFAAAASLRSHLLRLSFTNQFSKEAEEAWLELAVLVDQVEVDEAIESEELDQRVVELVKNLPDMVRQPVEFDAQTARDQVFLIEGTRIFLDKDALEGTPKPTSDVYALGVTIGCFLTVIAESRIGRRINFQQAWASLATGYPQRGAAFIRELGGEERAQAMAQLIGSMIDQDPAKRPANAMEVLGRLEEISGSSPVFH